MVSSSWRGSLLRDNANIYVAHYNKCATLNGAQIVILNSFNRIKNTRNKLCAPLLVKVLISNRLGRIAASNENRGMLQEEIS
jgi:hypothetical protein